MRDLKVGAIHVFGGSEPLPAELLNPNYGTSGSASRRGNPLAAATLLNRLQQASAIPLLTTADFEGGAGYILDGATRLPARAMAIAATRDPQLAFRAGQVTATEARAVGVTVDFYPIFDVNNNPRNPIIDVRSFGEDVGLVSEMGTAYMRGIQAGGTATAKHFPGHGDTNVDSHYGLPVVPHDRAHLDAVELAPFRAAIAAGVEAIMTAHVELPAVEPEAGLPATLSRVVGSPRADPHRPSSSPCCPTSSRPSAARCLTWRSARRSATRKTAHAASVSTRVEAGKVHAASCGRSPRSRRALAS